jgi:hypothetical protein
MFDMMGMLAEVEQSKIQERVRERSPLARGSIAQETDFFQVRYGR